MKFELMIKIPAVVNYTFFTANLLFLSLKVLTYPHILDEIKTNGLIASSKYPIKHLELFFLQLILR